MWLILFLLVVLACAANIRGAEDAAKTSKFILTAPHTFSVNKTEKIWLNIVDNPQNSDFKIKLTVYDNKTELHSVVLKKAEAKLHEVDFQIPETDEYFGNLEVHYDEGKNLSSSVKLFKSSSLLFVETDRPFYKPGELVRFRILHLQDNLHTVNKPINKIWIENPSQIKTAQWKQQKLNSGFSQLEFHLTKEPLKGTWMVKVQADDTSEIITKTFEVKEYVLPKFEVTLEPPSEFLAKANKSFSWKVCAKYSFGGPVQGEAKMVFRPFSSIFGLDRPTSQEERPLLSNQSSQLRKEDGCYEFVVEKEDLAEHEKTYLYGVEANVTIEEKGTGEKQEKVETTYFHYPSVSFESKGGYSQFYYPFIPFRGEFQLKKQNGNPIENVALDLFTKGDEAFGKHSLKNVVTDKEGKVYYTILSGRSNTEINVRAKCSNSSQEICKDVIGYKRIVPWFSTSDSYIAIEAQKQVTCDEKLSADVFFTFPKSIEGTKIDFNYIVESKGDVVKSGRWSADAKPFNSEPWPNTIYKANLTSGDAEILVGKWNLELQMEPKFSPKMKIIVYYLRNNQEIIASSTELKVSQCFQNKVKSKFVEKTAEPGQTVTLSLSSSAESLFALSGVDKAVTFLDRDRTLTLEKVFQKLSYSASKPIYYHGHDFRVQSCEKPQSSERKNEEFMHNSLKIIDLAPQPDNPARVERSIFPYQRSKEFGNTKRAFKDSGLLILSTFEHNKKPCLYGDVKEECDKCPYQQQFPIYAFEQPESEQFGDDLELKDEKISPSSGEIGTLRPKRAKNTGQQSTGLSGRGVPGASFAVAERENPKPDLVKIRSDFSETWLWQLEDISSKVTKNLQLKTPHTITDWVVNTICISRIDGIGTAPEISLRVIKPYFMDFTLPYSVKRGEILPLKVSLFNYLSHAIPIKLTFGSFTGGNLKGEQTFSTCLGAKDNLVHIFELDAKVIGTHNISVSAALDETLQGNCGPKEATNLRDAIIKPIRVKPEGVPIEITKSLLVCFKEGSENMYTEWQLQTPENTVRDSARTEVAVIGDLMGPSMENLGGLLRLPVGCGEQNMVLFVPNIVILNYLNATDSLSKDSKLKAKAIANMEAGYQRELNYRHEDGSYSAFGKSDSEGSMWLTAFVVKSFDQAKKFIFIDRGDLEKSTTWILSHQLENGCFRQVGKIFNKAMKGGITDFSPVALSAYIFIALLESKAGLDKKVFENGLQCLTKTSNETDLYTQVLSTYALQLINERIKTAETKSAAQGSLEYLLKSATNGNDSEIFWQKDSKSLGLNVEMTAYAILTLVKFGGKENEMRSFNAVRWISKQRNSQGGFISTQDTVVALEALATYASTLPLGNVNMQLKAITEDKTEMAFSVNSENRQILQEKEIPHAPTNLKWTATGKGCSLIQSTLRYNLKLATEKQDAFTLSKMVNSEKYNKCDKLILEFTLAYNLPDGASNMAVLEVELLSGYKPESSTLDDLKNKIPTFKRWDFDEGKVHLYFDSIESTSLNVSFTIAQKVMVENIKPAQIKLYDYYEQESFVRAEYGLSSLYCSP